MLSLRSLATVSITVVAALTVAACAASDSITAPPSVLTITTADGSAVTAATLRLRCELRIGQSSTISVDGNGVAPINGMFRSGVRSGGVTVTHAAKQAVLDQVEFDFTSKPNDIVAGAQPIPANFIVVNPSGPDAQARIVDASGATVAQGGAKCRVR